MKNATFDQAGKFLRERRARRRRYAVISVLALVVVFATVWGLSRQGHALNEMEGMEGELHCQYKPHVHSADCYDEDGRLTCGKVQYVVHEHDQYCYDEHDNLVCKLPEQEAHVHTDKCFETKKELVCELTESEDQEKKEEEESTEQDSSEETTEDTGSSETNEAQSSDKKLVCEQKEHSHDDSCYEGGEKELVCKEEVSEGHQHTEGCYNEEGELVCEEEVSEGHHHTDGCFDTTERQLTCGQEEHTHTTEDCYEVVETPLPPEQEEDSQSPEDKPETSDSTEGGESHQHDDSCYRIVGKHLICEEEGIHVHDDSCYQDGELICDAPEVEDIEQHQHDKDCFREKEESTYKKTFMDDKLYVTISYEETAEIDPEAELQVEEIETREELEKYEKRLTESEEAFAKTQKIGMLVRMGLYVDDELIVPADQVKVSIDLLDNELYAEEKEITAVVFGEDGIQKISGEEASVSFETKELPELGFIVGAEEKALTYEGDDYIVTVTLDEDTEVPENAELSVKATTRTDKAVHYEDCLKMLREKEDVLGEDETIALLLDMDIVADGKTMPLENEAEVSVQFLNNDIYFNKDAVKAAYITGDDFRLLDASDIDSEMTTTFTVSELGETAFIVPDDIRTMTCEGDGFIVTVRFGEDAQIPEDAQLQAEQITQESDPDLYAEYERQLREKEEEIKVEIADGGETDGKELSINMLVDIGFYVDSEEIEPQDTVEVNILKLNKDGKKAEQKGTAGMAHFTEEGMELLKDVEVQDNENGSSTAFQVDSFSVFMEFAYDDLLINNAAAFCKAIDAANAGKATRIVLDGNFKFPYDPDTESGPAQNVGKRDLQKDVTINLNGYQIELIGENITLIDLKDGAELTIVDEKEEATDGYKKTDQNNRGGQSSYATGKDLKEFSYDIMTVENNGVTNERKSEKIAGGSIIGNDKNNNAIFWLTKGTLTIEGGIFGNNASRVVNMSENNPTLNLYGGYFLNNGKDDLYGGVVSCSKGTINVGKKEDISGGPVLSNNNAKQGGAIYAEDNSTVNMNGGYITCNRATVEANDTGHYVGGGGIYFKNGSAMTMNGGYITGNDSKGRGAGIAAADNNTTLTIKRGYISGNKTSADGNEGGGIAIVSGATTYIGEKEPSNNKIYITYNTAGTTNDWGGGGIFIDELAYAYLYRTLITENKALGFGGGLGGCATGRIIEGTPEENRLYGAAIYGNEADGTAYAGSNSTKHQDKEYTENNPAFQTLVGEDKNNLKKPYNDYFSALYSHIENSMLGGGSEGWQGSMDGKMIDPTKGSWSSYYIAGLTAFPTQKVPEKEVNVYIKGNFSATHGGGIMCNGILFIGSEKDTTADPVEVELPSSLKIKASKKLVDADSAEDADGLDMEDNQFSFTIYSDEACTKVVSSAKNNGGTHNGNISFTPLAFHLQEDQELSEEEQKNKGFTKGTEESEGCYTYYIKEDDLSGDAVIEKDETVYKLEVRVKKQDRGKIDVANIHRYVDDIMGIRLSRGVIEEEGDAAKFSQEKIIYDDYNNADDAKYRDEQAMHAIELSLSREGVRENEFTGFKEGEASFVNKKKRTTEISVEKQWDSALEDTLQPDDYVTVALYQDIEGEKIEVPGQERITLSEATQWKGVWKNLPLRDDYSVKEVAVSKGELTDYEITYTNNGENPSDFIITNAPKKTGDLRIVKTLQGTNLGKDPVTFVFDVEATLDGKKVYSNVVTLVFDDPGTDEILVKDIPAGAIVTVKETYTGSRCTLVTSDTQTQTIVTDDIVTADFTNEYDGNRGGKGITNHFKKNVDGTWNWNPVKNESQKE